ncbi:MAG TPA: 16S rRNA (guanine(527)-N(7))-methyltransferase RsmG [Rhodocyclaceae bacterium]|nr:16S rRNA (guanine(527)-N(7))-methyltransferase RsmG [Rhodocyclaceae bacterium]
MNLHQGIAALGLSLPAGAEEALAAYLRLLLKWNRIYNLTAIRDESEMVTHHLLDSLAVLPHLGDVGSLADVGSGAGLPAIPLAIARPELRVTSIESNDKKATFQQQARIELALGNLQVRRSRAEEVEGGFDAAISRAFAELAEFVRIAGALAPRLYAMKGVYPEEEIARLPAGWRVIDAKKLTVPRLAAARHLIVIGRN